MPLTRFFVAFTYPVYLNLFCRKELDKFSASKIGDVDQDRVIGDISRDERRGSVVGENRLSKNSREYLEVRAVDSKV